MVLKWSRKDLHDLSFEFLTNREPTVGAVAEGRRAHFGVAAKGRNLYLSKTGTEVVFKWSQILPRPFKHHLNTTFILLFEHTFWEGPKRLK